ncbi:MAG: Protein lysine acetyltransferase Pat [bacterium]|nr:Protein lysine acetyltransferase Pat [bacterium]
MGSSELKKELEMDRRYSENALEQVTPEEVGHPLDSFFHPGTVALIGATEKAGSVGRTLLRNLVTNPFGGTVFPVNPKRPSVWGIKAYPSVGSIPEKIDMAVVVTPAPSIPGIIEECVEANVKSAIIISAGFKELGPEGAKLEQDILERARKGNIRIIGPNCLGLMNPITGLNATFASSIARPGNVGFISQSGALCTAILDWSQQHKVGFSAFVSIGSMVDVGWGDLIDYLGDDPKTKSIVIYMETVGDARSFISAAREVALTKPIIVIKAGRTAQAAKAAASHTGSLAGSDEVLRASFRRTGVLQVDSIEDLFYMAEVLAKQPRPKGPHLAIFTNAGGPGVLATDALIMSGGELAELSDETVSALSEFLPVHWSHGNPIDILGDADPDRYARALETVAKDPDSDGLLVILTPQDMTDPTQTAEKLIPYAKIEGKPVLASWMGGPEVAAGESILTKAGIPTFPYPDIAARVFNYMWRYSYHLRGLYETPSLQVDQEEYVPDREKVDQIISSALNEGRTILTEFESKEVLAAYGIPAVKTLIATTEADAVQAAADAGYPVVLKLYSQTITHKTDVGGVQLNLENEEDVRRAYKSILKGVTEKAGAEHFQGVTVQPMIKREGYEIIIGSSIDEQFGPVLLFGSGGQLVEVFKDRSLGLPPLNTTLARRMMEQTKIYKALKGVRGRRPVDLSELEHLMVRFSYLVSEQPRIREIDINPLLASPDMLVALDARVVIFGADVADDQLPKLAIRPYPTQYAQSWKTKQGLEVMIRLIRPEDEPAMVRFHETLSERTVYYRYLHTLKLSQRVTHERLTRICFSDYSREWPLVIERKGENAGEYEILGVGRLTRSRIEDEAEFAILVADKYQKQGLGSELLRRLIDIGRKEGFKRIVGLILPENYEMQRVSEKLGFVTEHDVQEGLVKAVYVL